MHCNSHLQMTLTSRLCVQLVALNREALVKALHQLGEQQAQSQTWLSDSCRNAEQQLYHPHTHT